MFQRYWIDDTCTQFFAFFVSLIFRYLHVEYICVCNYTISFLTIGSSGIRHGLSQINSTACTIICTYVQVFDARNNDGIDRRSRMRGGSSSPRCYRDCLVTSSMTAVAYSESLLIASSRTRNAQSLVHRPHRSHRSHRS